MLQVSKITLLFHGTPHPPERLLRLKQQLIVQLSPLFEERAFHVTAEKGEIFPDVNFLRINYIGTPIPDDVHFAALDRAIPQALGFEHIETTVHGAPEGHFASGHQTAMYKISF